MQRVAAPSANFCAGSSTKAPPLTAPCQIGRAQARRAGGFAAVGAACGRPQPRPPGGLPCGPSAPCTGLRGAHREIPPPMAPPPGSCRVPSPGLCHPPGPTEPTLCPPTPASSASPCKVPASGRRPSRPSGGTPGAGRRGGGCAAGPAARLLLSHLTAAAGPAARLPAPSSIPRPPPKPKPPTLPLGKPGACTFLHINSLTAPRFGLRPAAPDSPACSGGRRRPRRRNTPPAPPWPPGRHGRPRTPSQ